MITTRKHRRTYGQLATQATGWRARARQVSCIREILKVFYAGASRAGGHKMSTDSDTFARASTARAAAPMHTLFHKVWNAHAVRTLPSGQTQLFVGLHLIHEVTSPQAFDMLRQHGWRVAFPNRTFATVDHIVPTIARQRPFFDVMAEEMTGALERNCREFGINLWVPGSGR